MPSLGGTRAIKRGLRTIRSVLPRGGTLPHEDWERRHRALLGFLWVNTAVFFAWGFLFGNYSVLHNFAHGAALLVFAVAGSLKRLNRSSRTIAVSLGLLTAASLLVHLTGGLIESHFYFFVVVVMLTIYEDWRPFLVAVGYVLLHHGVMGTIDPKSVFNSKDEFKHPWTWAAIHALFVAMAGTAAVVAWRLNEAVRERMLAAQAMLADAAMVDSLTELPNRRQLMGDLNRVASEDESVLVGLFDLDGFKTYNDTFGHSAGDALLTRLAHGLAAAVDGAVRAYRLGGDEFCVIVPTDGIDAEATMLHAAGALSERGEGFSIACSYGAALMPGEAQEVEEVLQLADRRMYQNKNGGRPSAGRQVSDVLRLALEARNPELGEHLYDVADLSNAVAKRMGLPDDEVEQIRQASELHDVGKVAIPDAILLKPGPLTEEEWQFMERHTIIGERIVSAAPALSQVARLVRSHHERIDGGGYPDGLAGDEIPLGARIIFACDAFDAMTSSRPYRPNPRSESEALAEVRRCSGAQFDLSVVEALSAVIAERSVRVEAAA